MLLVLALAFDESSLQAWARAWLVSASGDVRSSDIPGAPTPVTLEGDLGVDDASAGFIVGLRTRIYGPIFFSVEYADATVTGKDTVAATFNFQRRIFAAGQRVETELKLRRVSFDVDYDFAFGSPGVMPGHVAPFIGARWYLPTVQLRNATVGFTEDDHYVPFLPAAGVRLRMEPTPWLELGAMLTGGAGPDFEAVHGRFLAADVEARVIFGGFTAAAGYSYETLDFEKDRHGASDLEVDFQGPYLELGFRF